MTRSAKAKVRPNDDDDTVHLWPWAVEHQGFVYLYQTKAAATRRASELNNTTKKTKKESR